MDHTPCKLEIQGEQSIHSISSFVHQSNSILSFFQISKDAHMAQKQPKNGTEKKENHIHCSKIMVAVEKLTDVYGSEF